MNESGYEFSLSIDKIIVDGISLYLFHLLHDNLFGALRSNTSQFRRIEFFAEFITDLAIRIKLPGCFY